MPTAGLQLAVGIPGLKVRIQVWSFTLADILVGYNSGIKCPLEYLQAQVTTLVSLLFITMIPIACKIYFWLFAFFRDHHDYFLGVHPTINFSGKSIRQYISYSVIFSPIHSVINRWQHEKHINPANAENTECTVSEQVSKSVGQSVSPLVSE